MLTVLLGEAAIWLGALVFWLSAPSARHWVYWRVWFALHPVEAPTVLPAPTKPEPVLFVDDATRAVVRRASRDQSLGRHYTSPPIVTYGTAGGGGAGGTASAITGANGVVYVTIGGGAGGCGGAGTVSLGEYP